MKEFPAAVTGSVDVVGYGAKEVTTEGVSPEFWLSQGKPGNLPVHVAFASAVAPWSMRFIERLWPPVVATTARPGCGPHYHPNYYGAFVLDPDGNNIEAVCRAPG